MLCSKAADLLNRLQLGRAPEGGAALSPEDGAALDALVGRGFVQAGDAGDFDPALLEQKKRELIELRAQREALSAPLPADLRAREQALRAEVLDLADRAMRAEASVEFRGKRYALTYLGRGILASLMTRLERIGQMEVEAFESELGALTTSFEGRAIRATQIFEAAKAHATGLDPSALRTAAVGLAARTEPPAELAGAFAAAVRSFNQAFGSTGFPRESIGMLAEAIVNANGPRPQAEIDAAVSALLDLRATVIDSTSNPANADTLSAAALLFPFDAPRRTELWTQAAGFASQLRAIGEAPSTIAPWILVAATGISNNKEALDWVVQMGDSILERGATASDAEMAAAILCTSPHERGDELVFQFETARAYLSRLSSGGMVVPAAMLAVLPTGIEETLDDLRMASSAVAATGLSTGGMEGLSLGLKLLMQTAVLASTPGGAEAALAVGPKDAAALSTFGLAGLSLVIPAALTAFAAFHEVTLQRFATSQYAYHPVHTHYYYG